MATLYDIYIDEPTDYPEFQTEIKDVLRQIAGNPVGRVILAAIEDKSDGLLAKEMKIVPYSTEDRKRGCNATTRPASLEDSAPEGVDWYLGKRDDPETPVDERYYTVNENSHTSKSKSGRARILGTGLGSSTEVHFTPSMWGESACAGALYAKMPDEVLLHEMVHGLRHMQGLSNDVPTKNARYKNEEEFLAIVTANVYISAKPSTRLRADHRGHRRLQPPLDTSVGFLANPENYWLMQRFQVTWKPTFQELARAGTPMRPAFNPFRQLEDEFGQMKAGEWKGTVYPAEKPGTNDPFKYQGREWRWPKG